MAIRDAMGEFMKKTDGSTDMPWWLEAPLRWWHAGPPGLKRGDSILPPSETGVMPVIDSDPTMVYVTSERSEAVIYATLCLERYGKMPHLYEVTFGVEPIGDDTQPESQSSFRVPSATVRRIESPGRAELRGAMIEIMQVGQDPMHDDDPIPGVADPFTDDSPIEATCNLENPEACEACD
jgi:hypothetical protein